MAKGDAAVQWDTCPRSGPPAGRHPRSEPLAYLRVEVGDKQLFHGDSSAAWYTFFWSPYMNVSLSHFRHWFPCKHYIRPGIYPQKIQYGLNPHPSPVIRTRLRGSGVTRRSATTDPKQQSYYCVNYKRTRTISNENINSHRKTATIRPLPSEQQTGPCLMSPPAHHTA